MKFYREFINKLMSVWINILDWSQTFKSRFKINFMTSQQGCKRFVVPVC